MSLVIVDAAVVRQAIAALQAMPADPAKSEWAACRLLEALAAQPSAETVAEILSPQRSFL